MSAARRLALLAALTGLTASSLVGLGEGAAQATTPVFGYGTPTFVSSAAPEGFDWLKATTLYEDQDSAGEPSIGVNWKTGKAMFMAGSSEYSLTFDNGATPPTVTWADASVPGSPPNIDPMLTVEPTTGTVVAGGDTGACSAMFTSTDDGANWLPSVPCTTTIDHPTVGWSPSTTDPTKRTYYYCQHGYSVVSLTNVAMDPDNCATSSDGIAWVPGAPLSLDCGGLHGHLRGGPDGTAYLPNASCFGTNNTSPLITTKSVGGLVTTDDGLTFTGYTIPGAPTPEDGFDPGVAVDAANTVYEGWNNAGDNHPVVTWSHDHGKTWAPKVDLATTVPGGIVASTFPTLVAGDAGRVAYTWLGTQVGAAGVDPFTSGFHGVWYAFTSYTYDGGATWTTVKDTPTPLQYGEIDAGGTTTGGQRNLLDFIDSSLTKDGRVVVALADGCLSDCESAPSPAAAEALSTHAYATVAYQATGKGLFAAYDVAVAPDAPTLTGTTGTANVLTWTPPADNGGAAITSYKVSRSSGGAAATVVATVTGTSWTDPSTVNGTAYRYTVTAVNSVGESVASNPVTLTRIAAPDAPALTVSRTGPSVQLSWTTPAANGSPITGYRVLRGTTSGGESLLATVTGTTYTDSSVTSGPTYYYTVAAVNAAGASAPSNEGIVATATAPGATSLQVRGGLNSVTLTWSTPDNGGAPVSSYVISRSTSPGVASAYTTTGAVTSFTDQAVTPGTTYYYRVAAVNTAGTGASSDEASGVPYTTAAAPRLTALAGKSQVSLSWTVPADGGTPISGYRIYRGLAAGSEQLVQTISTGTTYVDAGLVGGTTYYYRVAAVTTGGTGALSDSVASKPKR